MAKGLAGSRGLSEAEARLYRHEIWAKVVTRIGRATVSWTGLAFCACWAAQAATEWSGRTTMADLRLGLWGSGWRDVVVLVAVLFAVLFGGSGIVYGRQRGRLMRETVRHLGGLKRARETAIDPRRSSSGLTRSGETPDEED